MLDSTGQTFERGTHQWVSFHDVDGTTWMFDLTFLTSNWTCIYGQGCQGTVADPAVGAVQGCCSHGAYMIDNDDMDHVLEQAGRLTAEQWQHRTDVSTKDDIFVIDEEGDSMTRRVDGACIFLNRPEWNTGAGCALHYGAVANDEIPLTWKPSACWQLPFRLEELLDSANNSTFIVRPWYRGDWGEGGYEFPWWCTDDPAPLIGETAVYRSLRDELIALVGNEPYNRLATYIETNFTPASQTTRPDASVPVAAPRRRPSSEKDPPRS